MHQTYFNVTPRYTAGSPAQVDEATALKVVEQERTAHGYAQAGVGDALSLAGIVESIQKSGPGWLIHDLLTDERYYRPALIVEAEHDYGWTVTRQGNIYKLTGGPLGAIVTVSYSQAGKFLRAFRIGMALTLVRLRNLIQTGRV